MTTTRRILIASLALACVLGYQRSTGAAHVIVSKEPGRFGGWPANNGIWSWGNEIVVGFMWGYFKNTERGHAIDAEKPSLLRFARSLDGGETWRVEVPSFLDDQGGEREPLDCPGGIDFSNPDFAMRVRMNAPELRPLWRHRPGATRRIAAAPAAESFAYAGDGSRNGNSRRVDLSDRPLQVAPVVS